MFWLTARCLAGLGDEVDDLLRFGVVTGDWLLGQDAFDVVALDDFADDFQLYVGRHGDVDHFDVRIVQQLAVVVVGVGQLVAGGHFFGALQRLRADGDRVEARVPVGHQMECRP